MHRRQRRVVFLHDADVPREAVAGDRLHPLKHGVDVDRLALGRPLVGENLHAVDQPDDAIGLVADEAGQRAIVLVGVGFQQLRRAADAGKRVLDLCASMEASPVTVRAAPRCVSWRSIFSVTERGRSMIATCAGRSAHRRGVDVDDALQPEPRRGDVDAIFGDRRVGLAHLLDQAEDGAAERHEVRQLVAGEHHGGVLEEDFRRLVGAGDAALRRRS